MNIIRLNLFECLKIKKLKRCNIWETLAYQLFSRAAVGPMLRASLSSHVAHARIQCKNRNLASIKGRALLYPNLAFCPLFMLLCHFIKQVFRMRHASGLSESLPVIKMAESCLSNQISYKDRRRWFVKLCSQINAEAAVAAVVTVWQLKGVGMNPLQKGTGQRNPL